MKNIGETFEKTIKHFDNIKKLPGGRYIFFAISAILFVLAIFIALFGKE